MRSFWTDRIAIFSAVAGILLMVLTLIWRINPVEGSVVAEFLKDNPAGIAVFWFLFVTCMPAWIAATTLCELLPNSTQTSQAVTYAAILITQGITYFIAAKLISVCVRKINKRRTNNQNP
jgi:hypothetical protein